MKQSHIFTEDGEWECVCVCVYRNDRTEILPELGGIRTQKWWVFDVWKTGKLKSLEKKRARTKGFYDLCAISKE